MLNSNQESNAQSVQQLPVQNPQVEFRYRRGGDGGVCTCAREKPQVFFEFFKTREVTKSLQATGGCFPLSINPCA